MSSIYLFPNLPLNMNKVIGLLLILAVMGFIPAAQPIQAEALRGCPEMEPALRPEGPLCVPDGAKVVVNEELGIVAVTYWPSKSNLVEGPAPGIWIVHFAIREGAWEIVELAAMNHSSETREITPMWHDTKEWHAIGNAVMARQYEWVFNELPAIVWPGCEVGVVFRDLWWANNDLLFINFTLRRVQ